MRIINVYLFILEDLVDADDVVPVHLAARLLALRRVLHRDEDPDPVIFGPPDPVLF